MQIGLTGIIGSGKSTVAKILNNLGAYIIDADVLSHEVLKMPLIKKELRRIFPESVFTTDGNLQKNKIAELIFKDLIKKKEFEKIVHPEIDKLYRKKSLEYLSNFGSNSTIIYDAPLLFEVGYTKKDFDEIILVTADKEKCISRIMLRNNCNKSIALSRYNSQISLEEKTKLATIIIDNNETLDKLKNKTLLLWEKIQAKQPEQ